MLCFNMLTTVSLKRIVKMVGIVRKFFEYLLSVDDDMISGKLCWVYLTYNRYLTIWAYILHYLWKFKTVSLKKANQTFSSLSTTITWIDILNQFFHPVKSVANNHFLMLWWVHISRCPSQTDDEADDGPFSGFQPTISNECVLLLAIFLNKPNACFQLIIHFNQQYYFSNSKQNLCLPVLLLLALVISLVVDFRLLLPRSPI